MKIKNAFIIGIDLSLRHFGLVNMDYKKGNIISWKFLSDKKKYLNMRKEISEHALYFPPLKKSDRNKGITKEIYHYYRMKKIIELIRTEIFKYKVSERVNDEVYIAIEGYSYGSVSSSILQIAEQTGSLINDLVSWGFKIRVIEPTTLQIWIKKGFISKKYRVQKAIKKGFDISKELIDKGMKDYGGPATDLADAYWLAHLLRTELRLREGKIKLEKLPENRIKVMNRVTKNQEVNLLNREFIDFSFETNKRLFGKEKDNG